MRVDKKLIAALVFLMLIVGWLASGEIGRWNEAAHEEDNGEAELVETNAETLFSVRATVSKATPRAAELTVRGRTEAIRAVSVRAETSGTIQKLFADKGDTVKKGDKLCGIAVDARAAQLAEARAGLRKADLDKQAAIKLADKGFRSETQVASAQAAYDAALAAVRRMEIEIDRTTIRAPFEGTVDDRYVEVGDFLPAGQPCALVVDLDPIKVVGAVSEREVSALKAGDKAKVQLIGGQSTEGIVSFVARSADQTTRTFRVEVKVPNPEGAIRDGITADIVVANNTVMAHKISPAILSLNDKGDIGLRVIEKEDTVQFKRVQIIADGEDGVWVVGLGETATIITVGQEYVSSGQKVIVVMEDRKMKS